MTAVLGALETSQDYCYVNSRSTRVDKVIVEMWETRLIVELDTALGLNLLGPLMNLWRLAERCLAPELASLSPNLMQRNAGVVPLGVSLSMALTFPDQ